jgi:type II secretory pathway pseudopilin PulG
LIAPPPNSQFAIRVSQCASANNQSPISDNPLRDRVPNNRELITDHRNSTAFTLIELLVVISIIIILMGLLFPAFKGVQDQAKKTQAKNDLTQIVTAVNAFYTEYGRYPVLSTIGNNGTYDASNNDQLLNVLRGTANAGEQLSLNPRLIAFISPPVAKDKDNPKGGLGQGDGKYYDPWGTAYSIRVDANYSNWIVTNPPYQNAPTWGGVNAGAIAWSYGKDQKLGANGNADAKASGFDDVLSWQ